MFRDLLTFSQIVSFQAGLEKIPKCPNQFALVIFSSWTKYDIPSKDSIESVYESIKRQKPSLLEFGSGYEDQLKNWLCKPQSRKNDLIAINGANGLKIMAETMYCHGIETDIVLHVYAVCKKGCFTMLNPIPMTRTKSVLILSKFVTIECYLCRKGAFNIVKHGFFS